MNNLPFPRKRVFFTHNLSLCLFLRLLGAENIPPQAERSRKEGRKKRLCERRGNIFTILSVSFFNEVKNKLNIQTLNDMRTRRLTKEQGKQCNISRFPNFHKSGSIKGMKRIYYGMDALLVRCGDYIYK